MSSARIASDIELSDISRMFNAVIRGWINYYGRFYKSGLYPVLRHLNKALIQLAIRNYKKLRLSSQTGQNNGWEELQGESHSYLLTGRWGYYQRLR